MREILKAYIIFADMICEEKREKLERELNCMKIWGELLKVNEVYNSSKINRSEPVTKVKSKRDEISISNIGKDYQVALKAVKDIPDIRAEKVNDIKDKYATGVYNVSGHEIADKIVDSFFDTKV